MRAELVQLGVPPEQILLESTSRNTYDESGSHCANASIPWRSAGRTRHDGYTHAPFHRGLSRRRLESGARYCSRLPAPESWLRWALPTGRGLELSGEVTHELVGSAYYWLRGQWRSQ